METARPLGEHDRHRPTGRSWLFRDWVLGCRMTNLEFKNFPGLVFLHRKVGWLGYAGLGFSYNEKKSSPVEFYSHNDSVYNRYWSKSLNASLQLEFVLAKNIGQWVLSASAKGVYDYNHNETGSEERYIGVGDSSTRCMKRESDDAIYGFELPLAIERKFRIGRMLFSAGLSGQFLAVYYSESEELQKEDYTHISSSYTTSYTIRDRWVGTSPLTLKVYSPFNGSASIQLKCWF